MASSRAGSRGLAWMQILAYVSQVRDEIAEVDNNTFTSEQVEANPVRCPDAASAERMYAGTAQI